MGAVENYENKIPERIWYVIYISPISFK